MANLYLLTIGIAAYSKASGLKPIIQVENDILDINNYFSNSFDFAYSRCLFNETSTLNNIITEVDFIFQNCQPEDTVIIYINGHGETNQFSTFFLPYLYRKCQPLTEFTAFPIESIIDKANKIKPYNLLYFADMCYSGNMLTNSSSLPSKIDSVLNKDQLPSDSNYFILCSSHASQKSHINTSRNNSLATHCFLQTVCRTTDLQDQIGFIELRENLVGCMLDENSYCKISQKPTFGLHSNNSFKLPKILRYNGLHYYVTKNIHEAIKRNNDLEFDRYTNKTVFIEKIKDNEKDIIHDIVKQNKKEYLRRLLQLKMPINIKNKIGLTPLHIAAINGSYEITQLLIENDADLNSINYDLNTPLHFALKHNNSALIDLLLNNNADVTISVNKFDSLFIAGEYCSFDIICKILYYYDKNEIENISGDLLDVMLEKNRSIKDISNMLSYYNRNNINIDFNSEIFTNWMMGLSLEEISSIMLNYGEKELFRLCNKQSFYSAIRNNRLDFIIAYNKYFRKFDQFEIDYCLYLSLNSGNIQLIEFICALGGNLLQYDLDLNTLLHSEHISLIPPRVVEFLLKNGLDVNQQNVFGQSPLHFAANDYRTERFFKKKGAIFKILIKYGGDIELKDKQGNTPKSILSKRKISNQEITSLCNTKA